MVSGKIPSWMCELLTHKNAKHRNASKQNKVSSRSREVIWLKVSVGLQNFIHPFSTSKKSFHWTNSPTSFECAVGITWWATSNGGFSKSFEDLLLPLSSAVADELPRRGLSSPRCGASLGGCVDSDMTLSCSRNWWGTQVDKNRFQPKTIRLAHSACT